MLETWQTERGQSNDKGCNTPVEPTAYAISVSDRDGFLVHIRTLLSKINRSWTGGPEFMGH
jgi:hypothetical protein